MTAPVIAVRPDDPAEETIRTLTERRIGAVPVVDASARVLGIVTESDLLALAGTATGTAEGAMTSPAATVTAGTSVDHARVLLATRGIGRLPVVDGESRLTGIVSRRDLLTTRLPDNREIRRRITDRVIDMGGDVYSVCVAHGSVFVRGWIGNRSEIAVVERLLRKTQGVDRVTLDFEYETDDTVGSVPVKHG